MCENAVLPERNPQTGERLLFLPPKRALSRVPMQTAGKVLVLSDGFLLPELTALSPSQKVLFVLYDGDALPLFGMPDEVGAVIAAGGGEVLRAARFFAAVRRISCLALPSHAALYGAAEGTGEITIGGEARTVRLADCEIVCSLADMDFCAAYGEILLSRLFVFEQKTLRRFGLCNAEEGLCVWSPSPFDRASLVAANALLRANFTPWAGSALAAKFGPVAAYRRLLTSYIAFFRSDVRRYFVPDYRARAARAGVPYASLDIPTAEELARRETLFLRMREDCLGELTRIERADGTHFAAIRALGGTVQGPAPREAVSPLPERFGGLLALARDFGLADV